MRASEGSRVNDDADDDPFFAERSSEAGGDRWEPWIRAALIVLATHAAFIALAWAGSYFFGGFEGRPDEAISDLWRRWDTQHYIDIAEHGYTSAETDQYSEAFFPLFPMTIAVVSVLGVDPVFAGMFVSALASVVALAFLYKLAEEELYPGAGLRAALYLALFPTAVFLTAAYSEALFLAGAVAAFYFARQGRWIYVAVPAAVAMGTRIAGVFLLLGLGAEFIRQRDFDRSKIKAALVAGAVACLPLLAYMGYLWATADDPFYFFTAQRLGWHRQLTNPLVALKTTWDTYFGDYSSVWLLAWRIEVAAAFAGLFFTGWAIKRREFGYAVFMGTLMVPLLVSSWYLSIPRMLLSMFPIPLLIASVTRDEHRHGLVLATSTVFAALGVLVFTRGLWFF